MEENDALYLVIAHCEDELALWPASWGVPPSWRTIVGAMSRERCLAFMEALEAELRPDAIRRVFESQRVQP